MASEIRTANEIDSDPAMLRHADAPAKVKRSKSSQGHGKDNRAATGKKRNGTAENFITYPRSMVESPALRVLSLSAVRAMHRLEVEHMDHGGAENGRLIVTHDQFQEWGIAHNQVSPAIRELAALGLVDITEPGSGGNENYHRAARYRLTYVNNKSRAEPTHEWRNILTIEDAERIAAEARAAKDARASEAGRRGQKALRKQNPGPGLNEAAIAAGS
jgi:hypothetical protein